MVEFSGRSHSALITNVAIWEQYCVQAGKMSADLVHPMIYCPELHFNEFSSAIADMKNSTSVSYFHKISLQKPFLHDILIILKQPPYLENEEKVLTEVQFLIYIHFLFYT